MTVESEAAIPYAIDLVTGRDVEISQADPGHPHGCPKCRELVDQRRGDVRRPYFAHHPGATDYSCPWRTTKGIQQSLKESEDAAILDGKRIRLFVRRRPGSSEARLFGLIPPMTAADVAVAKRSLTPPQILASGMARHVEFSDLLPASSSGWIALDPGARQYRIEIRPSQLSNAGVWTAQPVESGSLFVGTETEAELVASPRQVAMGQWIYLVANRSNTLEAGIQRLRLGALQLLAVEASNEHASTISRWTAGMRLDQPSLRLDLVLPLKQSPWGASEGVVRVEPTKRILLAVTPPQDQDPGLYVYHIPFSEAGRLELSRSGAGKPRFIEVTISEGGASRLLIHWPLFHNRDVLLDLVAESGEESGEERRAMTNIGLEVSASHGTVEFLDPLDMPESVLEGDVNAKHVAVIGVVNLRSPPGFVVRLRAEYAQSDAAPTWQDEGLATSTDLGDKLRDSFERGAKRIQAHFGTLGVVTLRCPGIAAGFDRIRADELARELESKEAADQLASAASRRAQRKAIEDQITAAFAKLRGPIPRHISFTWIRGLLNLPSETASEELVLCRYLVKRMGKEAGVYRGAHLTGHVPERAETPEDSS